MRGWNLLDMFCNNFDCANLIRFINLIRNLNWFNKFNMRLNWINLLTISLHFMSAWNTFQVTVLWLELNSSLYFSDISCYPKWIRRYNINSANFASIIIHSLNVCRKMKKMILQDRARLLDGWRWPSWGNRIFFCPFRAGFALSA